jgi:DMSO/TMAO reductase YedYZ molybdopterin-dependent catalytic subunit
MTPIAFTRREFLGTAAAAGGALLAGCEPAPPPPAALPPLATDPAPFIPHGTSLETRLERLSGIITPNELFFVRNNAPTPRLDAAAWRLRVEGDAVERPLELSLADLQRLPGRSAIAYLECAGNWRGFFEKLLGRVAEGTQWGAGGAGCADWSGTSLAHVLRLAGVRANAVDVNLVGLDQGEFSRPMPLARAMDDETMLAWAMNGEPLPPDHGFPVRAVVPGWVGSNSVKWLGRIVVSSSKVWVRNNTTSYVMVGDEWPAARFAPAAGGPITTLTVKSALALPWPATLPAGRQVLRGIAYSPNGRISRVQWRPGRDSAWRPARIVSPTLPRAFTWFELDWDATPGSHTVLTRATDETGATQPLTAPFNEKGYLLNMVLPHPLEVA